ncbi:MAG: hypothetical protein E7556_07795 [Ruminococcaceae bacterium]|nr:hypothetical protein [Oscillospiraceae bacterium]
MKKTRYTTISGMVSALSVVIMLLTNIMPSMMYVIPIITGAIVFAVDEIIGKKWALGVFFVTSFISFILLTDKEAALNYTLFFGYYPLLKPLYEKLPKALSWGVKVLTFNVALTAIGLIVTFIFKLSFLDEDMGKFTIPIFAVLFNVVFVMYDIMFTVFKTRLTPLFIKLKNKLS